MFNTTPPLGHATETAKKPPSNGPSNAPTPDEYSQNSTGLNLLRNVLGSSTLKWLIECRDRPSEGPAPAAWIEQLVGRRHRFNFDKVTAVSTTGFSIGAQSYASETGIDLRTVKTVSHDAIRSWFAIDSMRLTIHRGELFHAAIHIDGNSSEEADAQLVSQIVQIKKTKSNLDVPFLICTADGGKHSFRDAWNQVMAAVPQLFAGLEPNCEVRKRLVQASYSNPQERYMLQAGDESVDVIRIDYQANISVIERDIPISDISEYVKTLKNESIAQSVKFVAETDDTTIWEFSLHKIRESGVIVAAARCIADGTPSVPKQT